MRVVAGEAGGVPLVAPPGAGTRPTADKVKGAIFSSLGERGSAGRVLDLFAGSGALGIEALSRGADWCDFVEQAPAACKTIRANLAKTRLADRAAVHCRRVAQFLAAPPQSAYDLIVMDPPYDLPELETLLEGIARSPLVDAGTTLLVEHARRRALPPRIGALAADRVRVHGDSAFTIYLWRPGPAKDGAGALG